MIRDAIMVQVSVIVNNVNLQVKVGRQSLFGNSVTQNCNIFYHKIWLDANIWDRKLVTENKQAKKCE